MFFSYNLVDIMSVAIDTTIETFRTNNKFCNKKRQLLSNRNNVDIVAL